MRDEEQAFQKEASRRRHISHLWAKLERQRREPRRTLGENLVILAGLVSKHQPTDYPWAYRRANDQIFKINQNFPNCWSYSS